MSLHGTFDTLGLEELLGLLAARRASGRLSVTSAGTEAVLLLRHGEIADAHVSRPRFATERPAPGRPGSELTRWIAEVLCDLLAIEKGSFAFETEPHPLEDVAANGSFGTVVPISTMGLLEKARERLSRWREVEPSIHSLDAVPVMEDDIPHDEVSVDRQTWMVLAAVSKRRTVAHLAREVGMDPLDACERLVAMIEEGLVRIEDSLSRASSRISSGGGEMASSTAGSGLPSRAREDEDGDALSDGKAPAALSF